MSDAGSEQQLDTPPYRRRFAPSSSSDCEDDDEDTLNSSTSTAGPPGSQRTGRYHRPWETGSNTSGSSPGSSAQRVYQRGGASKRTGSYRSMFPSGRHSNSNNRRSLSNASTVVSLMGSVQEWSRSFCVFNPVRVAAAAASRQSVHFGHQLLFSGKHIVPGGGVSSPACPVSGTAPTAAGADYHRPSTSLSTSFGFGTVPGFGGVEGGRSGSVLFTAGQLASPYASASPLLGVHWGGRHSMLMSAPSSPMVAAYYAMGGAARALGRGDAVTVSPARRELPMLLCELRCYLSHTGTPIISGNVDHPMDTRKGPLIGVGGFAKVYAGVDCVSGALVAIKEINIAEVNDEAALNLIGKEFGLLKSLRHPNIVSYRLFEHSASQKVCRIVMELLTGGSTLVLLEKYGPLREPVLRKFARHILQAIAFIHKEGISHRDIKPANILVSYDGVVKLCDFGCSKRVNELSKSKSCIIGTPLYMAPEFIKGEANHKSDIWSMACSLFELATGLLPWYHAGVRDNLPLMFYITTSSETPLVLPQQDDMYDFSPEFIDFMNQCFIRDVAQRPEAAELLKHPWITGGRVSPPDTFTSGTGDRQSPHWTPMPSPIDEELLCQQELEDVSAHISVEICNTWMMGNLPASSPLSPQHVEAPVKGDDGTQQPLERRLLDSQVDAGTSRCHSPALSSRGGGGGAPISPTVSLDAALHDNFNYAVPLGASAGRFVLPLCGSPAAQPGVPQYLRINADGNLDYAVADDDDLVEVEGDMEDALASSGRYQYNRTPSFHFAYGNSSPPGGVGGIPTPPPLTSSSSVNHTSGHNANSSNNNNNPSFFSLGRSPAGRHTRHVSMVGNQSMSLISNSSFASRGVSPSRRSQAASTASLTTSQQLPNMLMMTGSMSLPAGVSMNHSSDDMAVDPQGGTPSTSTVSRFPDSIKRDNNGRFCMSLSVPTGSPDRCVNIALSIDPEDVQCKLVERRPSYVVALSDDVKTQLAAKMNELASSAMNSPRDGLEGGLANTNNRFSRSAHGNSSVSVSPKSVSPTISPARRSFGGVPYTHYSPRPKRGGIVGNVGMASGGSGVRGSSNTNNSSPAGSCVSVAHSSSNGDGVNPPPT
ncbi:protein kinase [Trypanosoma grayi]|uniref:protein kinase n=1 Tax=Trypanosoma grayi TaxID=71804 RepID=UPI0004F4129A|nr:protein kinase [Trypanosoma grayi]KEG14958.1 protein kinase [Trypanosoma grayi]